MQEIPRSVVYGASRPYRLTVLMILTLSLCGVAIAESNLPPIQQSKGVEYVSGGFGENAADAFKQAQASFPLSLIFAEDAGGGSRPYVADVHVVIKNPAGATVMDVPAAGPYFLAKLEPGKYLLEATYMGNTQKQEIDVTASKPVHLVLTWKTT